MKVVMIWIILKVNNGKEKELNRSGYIDSYSACNVETLIQTQRTLWKHWYQRSTQCGNVDTKLEDNMETLAQFQAGVAKALKCTSYKMTFCSTYPKLCDYCWVPLSKVHRVCPGSCKCISTVVIKKSLIRILKF